MGLTTSLLGPGPSLPTAMFEPPQTLISWHGIDADKLDIDPTDPQVLMTGASFTMDTDAGPLDFLNDVPGAADYDAMRSRSRQAVAGGVTVWVVGYEDLIRMKEASGREQDLLDIHQLRDLHLPQE